MTEHFLSRDRLAAQLSDIGVERGGVLLVHASMRSLGPVDGGARTVADALRDALGPEGTLVVPAFTPENSDTSPAYQDRVRGLSEEAAAAVRAGMPPFDPATTPGRASAAEVSIELIRAWATGLRRIDMCSMPGRLMSST